MEKYLGIDLGTNSLGWAIVEKDTGGKRLKDCGVFVFPAGVNDIEGQNEPTSQVRSESRASRRRVNRRRLRKIALLAILSKERLCPYLSAEDLSLWRYKKKAPLSPEFLRWLSTDDKTGKNPYFSRHECLSRKLDLQRQEDRYLLGNALYHICQRRGFLSNRKSEESNEDGTVKGAIFDLSKQMEEAGCRYLGEYFYRMYGKGERIRNHYTARKEHYEAEFDEICRLQGLSGALKNELWRAIFWQRPLKSQKGSVGHCPFEKGKPRCPISHPYFEEFRALSLLNNVRVSYQGGEWRPLTDDERTMILSDKKFFWRKTDFTFKEIARKLAGKTPFGTKNDGEQFVWRFNYDSDFPVSGSPVTANLMAAVGISSVTEWKEALGSQYLKGEGKSLDEIVSDVWHALFSFEDTDKLAEWLGENLQLSKEASVSLAKCKMQQGYASLSLKAIKRILPFLWQGFRYNEAVMLAGVKASLPASIRDDKDRIRDIEENALIEMRNNMQERLNGKRQSPMAGYIAVREYLKNIPGFNQDRLYHHSMVESFRATVPDEEGHIKLGPPRTPSFKNPVVTRSLFCLRKVVNTLLDEGAIDPSTRINIEFARDLNDRNKRMAIRRYQSARMKERQEYADRLRESLGREATEREILKYQLWEEQGHQCLYTGDQIGLADFMGSSPKYDIEHTIPVSRGGDSSQMNMTLCRLDFNRDVKGPKLPSELANHQDILLRISKWKDTAESLKKRLYGIKAGIKAASTKEAKDLLMQRRHVLESELAYWRGKIDRFTMTEVPEGFALRQGVDIGIIGKYGLQYLKTVFANSFVVKGATTADFRKYWGIQDAYEKKSRDNHAHHCMDAITIASIGKEEYDGWKHLREKEDVSELGNGAKLRIAKPWKSFTEDVISVPEQLLVVHHTPDNVGAPAIRKIRKRGKVCKTSTGKVMYAKGDVARGSISKATFYGQIDTGEQKRFVVRKDLSSLGEKEVALIVDPIVRKRVQEAVLEKGSLAKAVADTIWMNREKGVPIKKVRVFISAALSPVPLKRHRILSKHEYKQDYYSVNEENYCMGIYRGTKNTFKLVSLKEAAAFFNRKTEDKTLVPEVDENGNRLSCLLKIGTMVLFYENTPEELFSLAQSDLVKRLYKVTGLSSMTVQDRYHYGKITLRYHQEARMAKELKGKNGVWKQGEDIRSIIGLNHNQCLFLVEGTDFRLTPTGKVVFSSKTDD